MTTIRGLALAYVVLLALVVGWLLFARLRTIGFAIGRPIVALFWLMISYPFAFGVYDALFAIRTGRSWYDALPSILFFHFALGLYALMARRRRARSWDLIWTTAAASATYATLVALTPVAHYFAASTSLGSQIPNGINRFTSLATASLPFRLALWIACAVFAAALAIDLVRGTRGKRSV